MSEEKLVEQDLSPWKLSFPPEINLRHRNFWLLRDVYLSPVALVIHLHWLPEPSNGKAAELNELSKKELKAMVRWGAQVALDYSVMRPVGVVITGPADSTWCRHIRDWAADQDWHRGEFGLYLCRDENKMGACANIDGKSSSNGVGEIPELRDRLFDLLSPSLQHVELDSPESKINTILKEIQKKLAERDGGLFIRLWERAKNLPFDEQVEPNSDLREQCREYVASLLKAWRTESSEPVVPSLLSDDSAPLDPSWDFNIQKITGISVQGFRGIVRTEKRIPLDADLILLSGPNGFGKSSLCEAIVLALTDHHYCSNGALFSYGGPRFEMKLDARTENAREIALNVTGLNVENSSSPQIRHFVDGKPMLPASVTKSLLSSQGVPRRPAPELDAALCGYFQEHVDELFEQNRSGSTLRSIFEPVPYRILAISEGIELALSEIQEELLRWQTEVVSDSVRKAILERWHKWAEQLWEIGRQVEPDSWHADSGMPAGERLLKIARSQVGLGETDRKLIPVLMSQLQRTTRSRLQDARRKASRDSKRAREIHLQVDRIRAELADIHRRFPNLDEELGAVSGDAHGWGLVRVLEEFQRGLPSWTRQVSVLNEKQKSLSSVLNELSLARPEAIGAVLGELQHWLAPRETAKSDILRLKAEGAKFSQELANIRTQEELRLEELEARLSSILSGQVDAWEQYWGLVESDSRAESRQAQVERLTKERELLNAVLEAIAPHLKPSSKLKSALERRVSVVMNRFLLAGDMQIALAESSVEDPGLYYDIKTQDERVLSMFSTGQKSQSAVAVLVGQNQLVLDAGVQLPHRVLIFDDVSTAYDLSNLSREAVLWRQLAYHPDGQMRRQVIISSHHEDLTNHLLDLLVPPSDLVQDGKKVSFKMLVIKFLGWSPETGPVLEFFAVEPSGLKDGDRQGFSKALEDMPCF